MTRPVLFKQGQGAGVEGAGKRPLRILCIIAFLYTASLPGVLSAIDGLAIFDKDSGEWIRPIHSGIAIESGVNLSISCTTAQSRTTIRFTPAAMISLKKAIQTHVKSPNADVPYDIAYAMVEVGTDDMQRSIQSKLKYGRRMAEGVTWFAIAIHFNGEYLYEVLMVEPELSRVLKLISTVYAY